MQDLEDVLDRLEQLLARIEALDEPVRGTVRELVDGLDVLHRFALARLGEALEPRQLDELRAAHPAVVWLFDAYGVGVDEGAVASAALEEIRPYVTSHGGEVEVLDVTDGVVRLRLSGACSGCTAAAITLREGVEQALRDGFPGFVRLEAVEDDAPPHPPPGPTLLQIQPRPR